MESVNLVTANKHSDIELLTAAQIFAVKEAKKGKRLYLVKFEECKNTTYASCFSDPVNYENNWISWKNEPYDHVLTYVWVERSNGDYYEYHYKGNGDWTLWVPENEHEHPEDLPF